MEDAREHNIITGRPNWGLDLVNPLSTAPFFTFTAHLPIFRIWLCYLPFPSWFSLYHAMETHLCFSAGMARTLRLWYEQRERKENTQKLTDSTPTRARQHDGEYILNIMHICSNVVFLCGNKKIASERFWFSLTLLLQMFILIVFQRNSDSPLTDASHIVNIVCIYSIICIYTSNLVSLGSPNTCR